MQNHKLDQAGREWSGSFQPTSQAKHGLPRVRCTGLWLDGSWASSVSDTPQPLWSVPVLHHLHGKDVLPNSLSIHFKHDLCALKYTFRREPRKNITYSKSKQTQLEEPILLNRVILIIVLISTRIVVLVFVCLFFWLFVFLNQS